MTSEIQSCSKCKRSASIDTYKLSGTGKRSKTCGCCLEKQKAYRSRPEVKEKKDAYNKMYNAKISANWDEHYAKHKESYARCGAKYYQRVTKPRKESQKTV